MVLVGVRKKYVSEETAEEDLILLRGHSVSCSDQFGHERRRSGLIRSGGHASVQNNELWRARKTRLRTFFFLFFFFFPGKAIG